MVPRHHWMVLSYRLDAKICQRRPRGTKASPLASRWVQLSGSTWSVACFLGTFPATRWAQFCTTHNNPIPPSLLFGSPRSGSQRSTCLCLRRSLHCRRRRYIRRQLLERGGLQFHHEALLNDILLLVDPPKNAEQHACMRCFVNHACTPCLCCKTAKNLILSKRYFLHGPFVQRPKQWVYWPKH